MDRPVSRSIDGEKRAHTTLEPADDRDIQRMGIAIIKPSDSPGLLSRIE